MGILKIAQALEPDWAVKHPIIMRNGRSQLYAMLIEVLPLNLLCGSIILSYQVFEARPPIYISGCAGPSPITGTRTGAPSTRG